MEASLSPLRSLLIFVALPLLACGDDSTDTCKTNPQLCPPDGGMADGQPSDAPVVVDGPVVAMEGGPGLEAAVSDLAVPDSVGAPDAPSAPYKHEDVTVQTVQQWINSGKVMTLLDVREVFEYQSGYINGAINLPWNSGTLKASLGQVPQSKPVVIYCNSGNRSNSAAGFMVGQGYEPVYDMLGGITAWKAAGLPTQTP